MPHGKSKGSSSRPKLVEASEYRAVWWGPMRDAPDDETAQRVRRYVIRDPDTEQLARFTAAEVAAECNLPVKVAHFDLEQLRDAGVLRRHKEALAGLGSAYVWERAHGGDRGADKVRVLGAPPPPSDAVPLSEAAQLLGITHAATMTMVREGILAIDERASAGAGATIAVRRRDVARARWWFRHKDAPYANRQLPPVYAVPPGWLARLDACDAMQNENETGGESGEGTREGA